MNSTTGTIRSAMLFLESQECGGKIGAFISYATAQPIKHVLIKFLRQADNTELESEDSDWYFCPSGFRLQVCCHESGKQAQTIRPLRKSGTLPFRKRGRSSSRNGRPSIVLQAQIQGSCSRTATLLNP